MKKYIRILFIVVLVTITITCWSYPIYELYNYCYVRIKYPLTTNQVWKFTYNEDDPFTKTYSKSYKIIDVKDDYVLIVNTQSYDTLSYLKNSVYFNAECVNCK